MTGFSFTSTLNVKRLGVPMEDQTVLLMSDYGEWLNSIYPDDLDYAAESFAQVLQTGAVWCVGAASSTRRPPPLAGSA